MSALLAEIRGTTDSAVAARMAQEEDERARVAAVRQARVDAVVPEMREQIWPGAIETVRRVAQGCGREARVFYQHGEQVPDRCVALMQMFLAEGFRASIVEIPEEMGDHLIRFEVAVRW